MRQQRKKKRYRLKMLAKMRMRDRLRMKMERQASHHAHDGRPISGILSRDVECHTCVCHQYNTVFVVLISITSKQRESCEICIRIPVVNNICPILTWFDTILLVFNFWYICSAIKYYCWSSFFKSGIGRSLCFLTSVGAHRHTTTQ